MEKLIYLDNAATTKVSQSVVDAMLPFYTEYYGNASTVYSLGAKSKEAITESRERIAAALGASANELYFTAGGSESDNWALKATAGVCKQRNTHQYHHNAASSHLAYVLLPVKPGIYCDIPGRG